MVIVKILTMIKALTGGGYSIEITILTPIYDVDCITY